MIQKVIEAYERESWHLDKKVPIAIILALAVHLGGFIWWASAQNTWREAADRRLVIQETLTQKRSEWDNNVIQQLAGLKATTDAMRLALDRIERGIDGKR